MRYNEFKKPQLTEEQIVLDYCLGEITKEDAVLHLTEFDPLGAFNKLKGLDKFLPNIFSLGPWSGEILIKGRPRVIFIASYS